MMVNLTPKFHVSMHMYATSNKENRRRCLYVVEFRCSAAATVLFYISSDPGSMGNSRLFRPIIYSVC